MRGYFYTGTSTKEYYVLPQSKDHTSCSRLTKTSRQGNRAGREGRDEGKCETEYRTKISIKIPILKKIND